MENENFILNEKIFGLTDILKDEDLIEYDAFLEIRIELIPFIYENGTIEKDFG